MRRRRALFDKRERERVEREIRTKPWTIRLLIIGINVIFFMANEANGLACYSCTDIGHPRACQHIDYCTDNEICGIQKFVATSGEVKFNTGCFLLETCPRPERRAADVTACTECCDSPLCNIKGCEESGITVSTGPVCFYCTGITNLADCRTIEICKSDEACFVEEKLFFNEVLYDLSCRNRHICTAVSGGVPIIGRRKRSFHCTKCCFDDLCNNFCGISMPTTTPHITETTTLSGGSFITSGTTPVLTSKVKDSCYQTGICRNNGVCLEARDGYTCKCEKGFYGRNCEMSGLQGKSFLLTFIDNYHKFRPSHIYITSDDMDGLCNIVSPLYNLNSTVIIHKQSTSVYDAIQAYELTDGKSNKGIFIQCNIDVFVIAFNEDDSTSDGWLSFPISLIGKDYIIPSYTSFGTKQPSVFGIVALRNNTNVNIGLRSESGSITYNNIDYTNGSVIQLTMSFLETFQISVQGDLSGTRVLSSEPIAIISGDSCAKVQGGGCSHLSEMVIPVQDFSKSFIIPILEQTYKAKLRAFAYNITNIVLTTKQNVNQSLTIFSQGYKEFDYSDITVLSSSENILLQLYGNERDVENADAFMITVPGVNQYISRYLFYVPDFQFNSSLTFIIKSNEVTGIRLDGKTILPQAARNVTVSTVEYTTFAMNISPGRHIAEQINHVAFGLFIYGKRSSDGYGYPAGMALLTK